MYVVGGKNDIEGHTSTTFVYDALRNSWTQGPSLPSGYVGVENPCLVAVGKTLFSFGGRLTFSSQTLFPALIYRVGQTDPFSGAVSNVASLNTSNPSAAWASLTSMPTARGGIAGAVIGSKIYLAGGMDSSGNSLDVLEVLNLSSSVHSQFQVSLRIDVGFRYCCFIMDLQSPQPLNGRRDANPSRQSHGGRAQWPVLRVRRQKF